MQAKFESCLSNGQARIQVFFLSPVYCKAVNLLTGKFSVDSRTNNLSIPIATLSKALKKRNIKQNLLSELYTFSYRNDIEDKFTRWREDMNVMSE